MEHVVKVVEAETMETVTEEIYDNACEAYMKYHIHSIKSNSNHIVTIDSQAKSLKLQDNG